MYTCVHVLSVVLCTLVLLVCCALTFHVWTFDTQHTRQWKLKWDLNPWHSVHVLVLKITRCRRRRQGERTDGDGEILLSKSEDVYPPWWRDRVYQESIDNTTDLRQSFLVRQYRQDLNSQYSMLYENVVHVCMLTYNNLYALSHMQIWLSRHNRVGVCPCIYIIHNIHPTLET